MGSSENNEETEPLTGVLKFENFIIDFSPKGGCTILKKMWLDYMGVLDEALSHEVVRNGRLVKCNFTRIHQFSIVARERFGIVTLDMLSSNEFNTIKYVRNPYDRAVSSYIHCCKHVSLFENGASLNPSFKEFLNLIIDNKISNPHYRIQNRYPEIEYDEIIKIEKLENETKKLNQKYDINLKCDFNSRHHVKKKNKIDNFFNVHASDVKKYLVANDGAPIYDSFYNDEIHEMVYEIYKTDIETYGYKSGYKSD